VKKVKNVKIFLVSGARPNFMKIAPLWVELKKHPRFRPVIVHTGQHYDRRMSALFFDQLDLPEPDVCLGVGSGTHGQQTARIMKSLEPVCLREKPAAVLVVGDVNSTVASVLVAAKLGIFSIHYEAGLRSNDRNMPEEINRIATDAVCDLFFTTSADADENLVRQGIDPDKVFMCGNLMIDSLVRHLKKADGQKAVIHGLDGKTPVPKSVLTGNYGLMTFHRPANVDSPDQLKKLTDSWREIAVDLPLVLPLHPRTRRRLEENGLLKDLDQAPGLYLTPPLGYLDFLRLLKGARLVMTDSGGIQEETTYLHIPCLTVRPSTERPVTISHGTNRLVTVAGLNRAVRETLEKPPTFKPPPPLWDGKSAGRIVKILGEKIPGLRRQETGDSRGKSLYLPKYGNVMDLG